MSRISDSSKVLYNKDSCFKYNCIVELIIYNKGSFNEQFIKNQEFINKVIFKYNKYRNEEFLSKKSENILFRHARSLGIDC